MAAVAASSNTRVDVAVCPASMMLQYWQHQQSTFMRVRVFLHRHTMLRCRQMRWCCSLQPLPACCSLQLVAFQHPASPSHFVILYMFLQLSIGQSASQLVHIAHQASPLHQVLLQFDCKEGACTGGFGPFWLGNAVHLLWSMIVMAALDVAPPSGD